MHAVLSAGSPVPGRMGPKSCDHSLFVMDQFSVGKSMDTARLLFISRDSALVRAVWFMGESSSWQLEIVGNAWEAMERVRSGARPDLLLLDFPRGDADGVHILRWLRRLHPGLPVIAIGHADDVVKREKVIRLGARDYLVRPIDKLQLATVIQSHLANLCEFVDADITSDDVERISENRFFIGVSPIMRRLRAQAASLAEINAPILILGEGGSGKETTARLVHELSLRSGFQFTKVNCAALPGDLLERELFGYERNAPSQLKRGKLELASKGTLLLDEITEMPLGVQANLVRVLQKKRFIRPGSSAAIEVEIRIMASSTRNIEHAVSENRFREDLYYGLSANTIHVPPLRERKEEVWLLSRHFMHRLARQYGLAPREFSPAMLQSYQGYSWPGNLHELEIFVKRFLMTGDKRQIFSKRPPAEKDRDDALPDSTDSEQPPLIASFDLANGTKSLRSLVKSVKSEAEKKAIVAALGETGGNRRAAAALLKVSYRTLLYKIEQYQLKSDIPGVPESKNPIGNGRTD
jgi:two-component system, NtrC family, response regulator AtoC